MLMHPFRPREGPPTYQEEYRGNYVPDYNETQWGPHVIAPNTPYVAAAGNRILYFIDTRFDAQTAQHIKTQIERAYTPRPEECIHIDEYTATAEVKNGETNQTTFVFDPVFAKVFFARFINKRNPDLKLPEYGPVGDWVVTYDVDALLARGRKREYTVDPASTSAD